MKGDKVATAAKSIPEWRSCRETKAAGEAKSSRNGDHAVASQPCGDCGDQQANLWEVRPPIATHATRECKSRCVMLGVMSSVWCWVCDVECVMPNVWCWVCDVGCVMSGVLCRVCDVGCVMLGVWCWLCDFECVMLGVWCWVCDVDYVMLSVWCWVCDVECVMLGVWCWVCDVECVMLGGSGGRREKEKDAAGCNDKNKNPTIECGEWIWFNVMWKIEKVID